MTSREPINRQTPNQYSKPSNRLQSLCKIFESERIMGWRVLQLQSQLYIDNISSMSKIQQLTQCYMQIIQALNSRMDPRQQYFTYKMQKLMAQPYIIRCFNSTHSNTQQVMEHRRKEFELKMNKEMEKQNHRKVLEQALVRQTQRQQKVFKQIKDGLEQAEKRLKERLSKRNGSKKSQSKLQDEQSQESIKKNQHQSQKRDLSAHEMSPQPNSRTVRFLQNTAKSSDQVTNRQFELSNQDMRSIRRQIQLQQEQQQIEYRFKQKGLPFR